MIRATLLVVLLTWAGLTPSLAGGSFDGVYTGTRTTKPLRPGVTGCAPADGVPATLTITINRSSTKLGLDSYDIEIAADGTFNKSATFRIGGQGATNGVVNISGKIVNGDLQMDRGNEHCAGHSSLTKS
ncbi:MAG TPA: hypothetical protein VNW90_14130 [Acetobacteraceae bacterium]|jgi:hypothetical protein|nr:hypothetical protein [Acetobacteraceae bacterium]